VPNAAKHLRLKKIGVIAATRERFEALARALGEPCVWLSDGQGLLMPDGVGEVVLDAAPQPMRHLDRPRAARRRESGRFFSRGRLIVYQCPEHID
jgi:hypothetical protein